jgi:hypothetical protein
MKTLGRASGYFFTYIVHSTFPKELVAAEVKDSWRQKFFLENPTPLVDRIFCRMFNPITMEPTKYSLVESMPFASFREARIVVHSKRDVLQFLNKLRVPFFASKADIFKYDGVYTLCIKIASWVQSGRSSLP